MDIASTLQRSTWHRTSFGRRSTSTEPHYFSIIPGDAQGRDALRRQTLADLAGLDA